MFKSVFPPLDIPKTNILSYLYPTNQTVSDNPIWIDAQDPANSLSPRQMLSWVRRLGFGLDRLGVGKGEVVMIVTPNHIFVPVAYQGIVGSGRIFSGANPIYTVPEIQHQLKDTGAKVILAHPSLLQTVLEASRGVEFPEDRIFQFSDRPCRAAYGILDWREMVGSEEEANMWKWDDMTETADSTIATINYSSGTTGLPKGVCVSHSNLIANVEQSIFIRDQETSYAAVPGARPAEKWVGFLPLYHAYGKRPLKTRQNISRTPLTISRPTLCDSDGRKIGVSCLHYAEICLRGLPRGHSEIPNYPSSSGSAHLDHA